MLQDKEEMMLQDKKKTIMWIKKDKNWQEMEKMLLYQKYMLWDKEEQTMREGNNAMGQGQCHHICIYSTGQNQHKHFVEYSWKRLKKDTAGQ